MPLDNKLVLLSDKLDTSVLSTDGDKLLQVEDQCVLTESHSAKFDTSALGNELVLAVNQSTVAESLSTGCDKHLQAEDQSTPTESHSVELNTVTLDGDLLSAMDQLTSADSGNGNVLFVDDNVDNFIECKK